MEKHFFDLGVVQALNGQFDGAEPNIGEFERRAGVPRCLTMSHFPGGWGRGHRHSWNLKFDSADMGNLSFPFAKLRIRRDYASANITLTPILVQGEYLEFFLGKCIGLITAEEKIGMTFTPLRPFSQTDASLIGNGTRRRNADSKTLNIFNTADCASRSPESEC
jgi:hypothetical protein